MNRECEAGMSGVVRRMRRGLRAGCGVGRRTVFPARRGERGVSMVELMVAMFIFMMISGIFLTSIIQFLHTTTTDAIRTRSASEIATATQRIDRYVRYASAMEYDDAAQRVTMLMPGEDAGAASWSSNVVLGSLMNHSSSSGVTSDDSLFGAQMFGLGGTKKVLTFSPVAGSYSGGKPITSNVTTTFTARNVKATNPTPDFSVCS